MKLSTTLSVGLLPLLVIGYISTIFNPVALLRQQKHKICPEKSVPENLQVLGSRKNRDRAIVLYAALCREPHTTTQSTNYLGKAVFIHKGLTWQLVESDGTERSLQATPPSPLELVDFSLGSVELQQSDRVKILYGYILSPKVVAVEATLGSGKTIRDQSSDGVFALFVPPETPLCEVRVLGPDGQILRRDILRSVYQSARKTQEYLSCKSFYADLQSFSHG